jgi:hypothetical protein
MSAQSSAVGIITIPAFSDSFVGMNKAIEQNLGEFRRLGFASDL